MSVSNNTTIVQTVVPIDLRDWLSRQAKQEGRSLSNYVAFVLEQVRQSQASQLPLDGLDISPLSPTQKMRQASVKELPLAVEETPEVE